MTKAISIADAQHPWIRMLPGSYSSFMVSSGSMSIVGVGATADAGVTISANANVTIRGLHIGGLPGAGPSSVQCTATSGTTAMTLHSVALDGDLLANNCHLTLRSVVGSALQLNDNTFANVDRCRILAISATANSGSTFTLQMTNTIAHNFTFAFGTASLSVLFAYDTFYANDSQGGPLVDCTNPLPAGITFVNNIFYDPSTIDDAIKGTHCTFDNNVAYPQIDGLGGTGTIQLDPKLVDPATGDFHLQATSPAIDLAKVTTSDPPDDYDGTLRPQGARRDVGAFEYKP
jgi:hypothetical protein